MRALGGSYRCKWLDTTGHTDKIDCVGRESTQHTGEHNESYKD